MIIETNHIPPRIGLSVMRLACHLHEVDECQISDFVTALRCSFPNATNVVISAESSGLISRRLDPMDRRRNIITLTPLGERLIERLKPSPASLSLNL